MLNSITHETGFFGENTSTLSILINCGNQVLQNSVQRLQRTPSSLLYPPSNGLTDWLADKWVMNSPQLIVTTEGYDDNNEIYDP